MDLDRGRERGRKGGKEGGEACSARRAVQETQERGSLHKNTIINKNKIQYNYV